MAIFYFEVKFDLEVQGQLPLKTIGILTKVFCSSGPNLVILAWTGDKLSRGQASGYRTYRHTDRQTQPTTIPEGQNWPPVKMLSSQWDNNNRHFVYIIVSWYLLRIITCQGFLFSCSCMNRCTCTLSKGIPLISKLGITLWIFLFMAWNITYWFFLHLRIIYWMVTNHTL